MPYVSFPEHNRDNYKGRVVFSAKHEVTQTLANTAFEGYIQPFIEATGSVDVTKEEQAAFEKGDREHQTFTAPEPEYEDRGSVQLYLPNTLQFNDQMNYADADLGISGGAAFNAIRQGGTGAEALGAVAQQVGGLFSSVGDALTAGMGSEAAQVAALRLASMSSGMTGAIETATGVTLNPNRRSTFKDVPIRKFQFTFKLIPLSKKEHDNVEAIIKFFRSEMYPEAIDAAGIPVAFRFPSKFDIKLYYNNKRVGTGILPCFLENCQVVYNPNNMAYHSDGNPQEVDLVLGFREERALNKKDVLEMGGTNPAFDAIISASAG